MRTRHSLTAAVVAIVVILVGVIISLLAGGGPNAHAEEPGTAPSVVTPARPPDPGAPAGQRHDTNTHRKKTTTSPTRTRATASTPTTTPPRTPTTVQAPQPPRLGQKAKTPAGVDYDASDDGQVFTATFSALESGPDIGRMSRTQTITIPVTGDTDDLTLALALQGYAFADHDSVATLTVTVNGVTTTRSYRTGTDRSYVEYVDVPLRGVHSCRITVRVAVDGAEGYLNTAAIDGQLG